MDDLDALLDDLEACIPAPITCGPKPTSGTGQTDDIILDMQPEMNGKMDAGSPNISTLHGNLSELDLLLNDLYSSEEQAEATESKDADQASKQLIPVELELKQSTDKSDDDNIDSILQKLDGKEDIKIKDDDKTNPKEELKKNPSIKTSSDSPSSTHQLDELMMSLAGFGEEQDLVTDQNDSSDKIAKPVPDSTPQTVNKSKDNFSNPAYEIFRPLPMPPNANDLDVMLQDMNTVLGKQGIRAASKGLCHACKKPVMGEDQFMTSLDVENLRSDQLPTDLEVARLGVTKVTTALGKVWHPEHFVCAECDQEIGTKTFFEREGKPYCEGDYHKLFSPPCAYCHKPVLGQCVTALNNTWHPEHFFCAKCSNYFGDEGFHEHDGKPYCRADFYNLFAPHCKSCNKPILSNYISALNAQWHPECFVCGECLAPFTNGSFFELNGRPFCETHYHHLRGSLCAKCQKPITGRCITAMSKKFHPEHFTCAFCLKQLNKGTFKEMKDQPYCHLCHTKLFGTPEAV